jgi:selenocysteine lyase/cysteine desulfurase
MVTRRLVIGAAAAGSLAGCTAAKQTSKAAVPLVAGDWRSVRAQFGWRSGYANMAAFVFASHPAPVRDAIERHRRGLDEDPTDYLGQEGPLDRAVALAAASYLDTKPEQLAFTDSTTMGLGLLYSGLRLGVGEEILTTEHDFYATHESLRLRAVRDGTTVRRVRLYDDPATASVDEIVGRLTAALSARTRVVAVTWVHSGTGVKLPIRAIADAVHQRGALLCVDGVHGFGAVDAAPEQLGADFLVSGCHKWLFGPRGTGLIWGRPDAWKAFTPIVPSFERSAIGSWITGRELPSTPGALATPGGYHSFEHRWALAEAFDFHRRIGGRAAVGTRVTALATKLKEGLRAIDGVTVHTPMSPELSAGVVCCTVRGMSPADAVRRLRDKTVIASETPYATAYLRFGPSLATLDEDVDKTLAAVRSLR